MKRQVSMALLLALTLSAVGCVGESPIEASDTTSGAELQTTTEAETTRLYYDTNDIDYGGYNFRILNLDNVTNSGWAGIADDIYVESETGDVLNDAVFKRNQKVEETLGITISSENLVTNDLHSRVQSMVMSGDDDLDLMFIRQASISMMATNDWLVDLKTVSSFDFDEPWWNENFIDSLTVCGKLFAVVSEATYFDKMSTYVTFYNTKLAEDYKLGDLYGLVADGAWTLDKLLDFGKAFSSDVNMDGKYDENDHYPLSCQNDAVYIFLNSAGIPICSKNKDGEITFNLKSEQAITALQSIFELITDPTRFFNRQDISGYTLQQAIQHFTEGGAMFMIRPIQSLFDMRNMQSDFGILPIPKFDENQEKYTSSVNLYTSTAASIPVTSADPERSAVVLSLMACESYYSVTPALYETVLGNKLIRDERSSEMLDLTFSNRLFDLGLVWNFGSIISTLLWHRGTDVASFIANLTPSVETAIKNTNEQLAGK